MKQRKNIFIVIGAVTLMVGAYLFYEYINFIGTDNAQIEAHTVMLAPKVAGFVTKVNIEEGQKVKAGEVLIQIDPRDYENTLKQVQSDLVSMEARKKDADKNYHRLLELYSKGVVSQQQYDKASTSFSDIKAKYEAINARVVQAQINLDSTQIKAPSDGFIAKKSVEVAQFAAPGVPLIGFVDAGPRWITANFKETEIKGIKVGSEVEIEVDAFTSRSYKGKVLSLSSATGATFTLLPPDNATGNFTKVVQRIPVKISIENTKEEDVDYLKAGLSVFVKVHKN